MKIQLKEITIRELSEGYKDTENTGVIGYGGKLNIRPPYQREFIYKDKQRNAVITTVLNDFPLNTMYWSVNSDKTYEVIDGQQRTISICQFVNGEFSYQGKYFKNLYDKEREQILNYKLMVYVCEGSEKDKLDWFKTINIAGEELTAQELRNATYYGPWLTDAKQKFSKRNCVAYKMAKDYVKGSPIRQDYLETVIKWISGNKIEDYMSDHQNDPNAGLLWRYFQNVISWVESTFPNKRVKFMKGVNWGALYNEYKDVTFDQNELEDLIQKLVIDDDVTKKSGIYAYTLTKNEKFLSIRSFTDSMKQKAYERQLCICPICGKSFDIGEMEGDHIIPWSEGGKTNDDNLQMLCKSCNRHKSNK